MTAIQAASICCKILVKHGADLERAIEESYKAVEGITDDEFRYCDQESFEHNYEAGLKREGLL